ncbi:SMI1/KNR4 family protein [Pseudomonas sp. AK106]|jgi:hypothetical protein|nr:MAG: SMI1/KNR4 family protein [Pedobacter sp.]
MDIDIRDAVAELKSVRMSLPNAQRLPDDALIVAYERELGISFSDEYKIFAKEASDSIFNGKDALRLTVDRNSPRELLNVVAEAREQGVPKSWLPICEDNGNYYCLLEDGSVSYWAHDGRSNENWPSLASWIKHAWIDGE